MNEALRNLQIFRNGALIVNSRENIIAMIEGAYTAGTLSLHDGEPISVRYKETTDGDVKGVFGIAYNPNGEKKILWTNGSVSIETTPKEGSFVTLNHTEDENGNVLLTVATKTVALNEVTDTNDGLAVASDVKSYIYDYKVAKEGTTYTLQRKALGSDTWENVDEAWDIDTVVESGSVVYRKQDPETGEWDEKTEPTEGYEPYLKLVIKNNPEAVYIPAKDFVHEYTAGDGISIEESEISIKLGEGNVELSFNEEGELVANYVEAQAVVENNLAADTLNVTTEGNLNQNAMAAIESYIDNYDCGVFNLPGYENAQAIELKNTISGSEPGTTVDVNSNINVEDNDGAIVIG